MLGNERLNVNYFIAGELAFFSNDPACLDIKHINIVVVAPGMNVNP